MPAGRSTRAGTMLRWLLMQLSDVFLAQGEEAFRQLLRSVSIGKLRTYQLFDRVKARTHLAKLNSEHLRHAAPRLWARLTAREDEFAEDLAQAVLVSHLDMIREVLNFLGIPNENGFFARDMDAGAYFSDGWQQRVWEKFRDQFPVPALLFYINHLGWELAKEKEIFAPPAVASA